MLIEIYMISRKKGRKNEIVRQLIFSAWSVGITKFSEISRVEEK